MPLKPHPRPPLPTSRVNLMVKQGAAQGQPDDEPRGVVAFMAGVDSWQHHRLRDRRAARRRRHHRLQLLDHARLHEHASLLVRDRRIEHLCEHRTPRAPGPSAQSANTLCRPTRRLYRIFIEGLRKPNDASAHLNHIRERCTAARERLSRRTQCPLISDVNIRIRRPH